MKFFSRFKSLIEQPQIASEYLLYISSSLNYGKATRTLNENIKLSHFSGFSEFYTSSQYISFAESKFLKTYAFEQGDIVDVGANLGGISIALAKRFPERKIYSFEPNPHTFKSLLGNIKLNNLDNVKPQRLALAKENGFVSFDADPIARATCSINRGSELEEGISVPCMSLDSFVKEKEISEISFLKVDVEGYESLVFQGGKAVLDSKIAKVIYFEVCPNLTRQAGFSPTMAGQLLLDSGYNLLRLNSQSALVPVDLAEAEGVHLENWIAIPENIEIA